MRDPFEAMTRQVGGFPLRDSQRAILSAHYHLIASGRKQTPTAKPTCSRMLGRLRV